MVQRHMTPITSLTRTAALATVVVLLTTPFGRAATVAFQYPAPSAGNPSQYPHDGPWINGLDFNVLIPTQILALGTYDSDQDGVFDQPVKVAIFDVRTGLAATPAVEFTTASPGALAGGSRFKSITPVTLSPGQYSIVAGQYGWGGGSGEPSMNYFWNPSQPPSFFYDGSGGKAPDQGTRYRFDVGTTLRLPPFVGQHTGPIFTSGTFEFVGLLATRSTTLPNDLLLISPNDGTFTRSLQVTLTAKIEGADIRYTIDGTEPNAASPRYDRPITLDQTATVKARLFVGASPAPIAVSGTFTRVPEILFVPAGGLFTNRVAVTLVNHVGVGSILYTLDGTEPNAQSPAYVDSLTLASAATIKASVFFNGFRVSEVWTATYLRVYAVDDGIPNAWREQFFGPAYLTDPRVSALEDPDHDGANNLQEYTNGSHPLDPLSGFAVGIQPVPMIRWSSVPDQVYRILRKSSLQDPAWTVVAPEFKADSTNSTYVDAEVAGQRAYYAIEVKKP